MAVKTGDYSASLDTLCFIYSGVILVILHFYSSPITHNLRDVITNDYKVVTVVTTGVVTLVHTL